MVIKKVKKWLTGSMGFTLTEMLGSILIITVMASIAVINLSHSSILGARQACQTDYRTVSAAINGYTNDAGSAPSDLKALVSGGYMSDPEASIANSNMIIRTQYQLQVSNGIISINGGSGFTANGISDCLANISDNTSSSTSNPSPSPINTSCVLTSCPSPTPNKTLSPAPVAIPSGFNPSATPSSYGTFPYSDTAFSPTPVASFAKGANKTLTITGIDLRNVAGIWMGTKPVTSWSIDPTYTTLTAVQPGGGQTNVHIYVIFTNGSWWTSPGVYSVG